MNQQEARIEALGTVLADIEKKFGKGSVMRLGEQEVVAVEAVSSGVPAVDDLLGIGGIPKGRLIEIFGKESSGKTTLTLHAIAAAQQAGGTCAFIDAEHALDVSYARKLGVDTDALLVSQPDNGEAALEITERLVRSGAVDLVVIDSVAALVPRAEIEGEMGDHHVGTQARLMSQALRKLAGVTNRTQATVIFINQTKNTNRKARETRCRRESVRCRVRPFAAIGGPRSAQVCAPVPRRPGGDLMAGLDEAGCWCGEPNPYYEPVYRRCFGDEYVDCICGGDQCICHWHGEAPCPGCEDCDQPYGAEYDDLWGPE